MIRSAIAMTICAYMWKKTHMQSGGLTRVNMHINSETKKPLVEWIRGTLAGRGMISPRDPRLLHVVDTVDEAVDCVVAEAWRLRNGDDAGSGAPGAR